MRTMTATIHPSMDMITRLEGFMRVERNVLISLPRHIPEL